jgi:hypothetical protein
MIAQNGSFTFVTKWRHFARFNRYLQDILTVDVTSSIGQRLNSVSFR